MPSPQDRAPSPGLEGRDSAVIHPTTTAVDGSERARHQVGGAYASGMEAPVADYAVYNDNNNANHRHPEQHDDGDIISYDDDADNVSAGVASTTTGTAAAEDDPSRLFTIIEEGMPRPHDATKQVTQTELNRRKELVDRTYDRVRKWLWAHPEFEDRSAACAVRGANDATCLHNICKLADPPADIIIAFLAASPEMASVSDSHGWLPLHHACANGASGEVLQLICEAYPEGKLKQDSQKRTPLHFYLAQRSDALESNIGFLSDTGAAELPDVGGMIPMHYACAYGVSQGALEVLEEAYPDSLLARENNGRTPMHLALVNAHRKQSPGVIEFLIENSGTESINIRDNNGYLPIHLLALGLRGFHPETADQRNNVSECLKMYLGAKPHATADFLTALQDLPDWLQDVAVVSPHVRNILNKKIVQRFPTSILMMDGYMLIVLIVTFQITTFDHINARFDGQATDSDAALILLLFGGAYFLARELLQIISLWSLGNVSSWFYDPTNWLDMTVIVLVFYYGVLMTNDDWGISDEAFRYGVAFTKGVLWLAVIYFLKSTLVDFAVFVGGVFYVLQRLAAFLLAVGVILLAFAQMFYIVYTDTAICSELPPEQSLPGNETCGFPHCSFDSSLLKVYTMMMGEIGDETRYETSQIAQVLYVLYAFLVVILLSNVLIAIVTDSYEIIQNDRAAIVFWSNRLDFIAEMDGISYGLRNKLRFFRREESDVEGAPTHVQESPGGDIVISGRGKGMDANRVFYDGWKNLVQLFDQHLYDDIDMSPSNLEFWCYFLFRGLAVVFVIPIWIIAGLVTAGALWPPQIREYLFVQKETAISRADLEKQKLEQLKEIQNNIKSLKGELKREMAVDRSEMSRMRSEVDTVQSEVMSDLQQVRELMTTLLDMGRRR